VSDIDAIKAEIKKLSAQAMQAKMDLHDLSEELPINYERIPEVAQRAFEAYRALEARRAALKTASDA
jgi:hypothetical protein